MSMLIMIVLMCVAVGVDPHQIQEANDRVNIQQAMSIAVHYTVSLLLHCLSVVISSV